MSVPGIQRPAIGNEPRDGDDEVEHDGDDVGSVRKKRDEPDGDDVKGSLNGNEKRRKTAEGKTSKGDGDADDSMKKDAQTQPSVGDSSAKTKGEVAQNTQIDYETN